MYLYFFLRKEAWLEKTFWAFGRGAKNMKPREAMFWRIRAALQELTNVTDEEVERNQELKHFLNVSANIVLTYKERGADFVAEDFRRKELEDLGVAILDLNRKVKKDE